MDGVLIAEPVGTLDSIVHVPSPIVLVHVPQSGIDASLGGHGVAPRGEELGDAGRLKARLGETECCPQARTAGTDDDGIVLVVLEQREVGG